MNYKILENTFLKEKTYVFDHPTGLKIYISPKEGYSKKCAIFGVNYGSIDSCFKLRTQDQFREVPDGIAHFLEHKLFESEDGDAFTKYAKTGASANAFTSFQMTAYYFTCTDRFEENLKILSDLMQTPYFTPENVAKEQGIIGQEINMYLDDPGWRVYFNMLEAMYHRFPVKKDIAGSVESISHITSDLLFECYRTFYTAPNMTLCITGDLDPIKTAEYAGRLVKNMNAGKEVDRYFEEEPPTVVTNHVEQELSVSIPIFYIGFKDNHNDLVSDALVKKELTGKMLLDILFGRSSSFFDQLYKKGLINDNFDHDYTCEIRYAHSILSGESEHPEQVHEQVLACIQEAKDQGIEDSVFQRQKKLLKSQFLRQLNNIEITARNLMEAHFKGYHLYDLVKICDEITLQDVTGYLEQNLKEELCVLSIIKPKKGE